MRQLYLFSTTIFSRKSWNLSSQSNMYLGSEEKLLKWSLNTVVDIISAGGEDRSEATAGGGEDHREEPEPEPGRGDGG
jgi:hypothetical protein